MTGGGIREGSNEDKVERELKRKHRRERKRHLIFGQSLKFKGIF